MENGFRERLRLEISTSLPQVFGWLHYVVYLVSINGWGEFKVCGSEYRDSNVVIRNLFFSSFLFFRSVLVASVRVLQIDEKERGIR